MNADRLQRLQDDLTALVNDDGVAQLLREDAMVTLATLSRFAPAPDPEIPAVDRRQTDQASAEGTHESAVQARSKASWLAGEVPLAAQGHAASPAADAASAQAAPSGGGQTLDVDITPKPDGTVEVAPKTPADQAAARTVREMLNAMKGRELTPLGDVALDLVLATERWHLQHQRYVALVQAGRPLLIAGVDATTPQGQAVIGWYNEVLSWRI